MEEDGRKQRPLVVLISSPFHGHMTPTLQLATALHAKGLPIAIAHTSLNPPNPSNHPSDFTFLPLSDNLPAIEDSDSFIHFINILNRNCKPSFQEHLTRLIIPVLRTSRLFLLVNSSVNKADFLNKEIVPNHYPLRYKDLPFPKTSVEDWKQLVANFNQQAHPSAVVWNTIKFLEQESLARVQNHYEVPVFAVGPLHKITPSPSVTCSHQEDTGCITWLDKQPPKSVVYISFGSLATMDAKLLTEMAWGLAKSNQRFLWAVRPGLVCGSEWLELLPDGFVEETRDQGLIVKWAPQKEVLAHCAVGGFWSHCGWNSCLESISSGVVMICQPFSVDQGVNARYVSYMWRIGLEMERVDRGEIERMVRRVMVDDEGEEMRVRANDMKEMVKEAVEIGGSSQDSMDDLVNFILSR
ncbi:hypothetical protein E3N88_11051 [Mikania micrantha]|uniref:UDP-glycosyltransferases domain-containing protein n=1 Tax=Mikania micrantha TaxID=192012 RepID=A0A5N6PCC2_9ASTR|nr:hypothetical protein E3N88_11051 [Mikania micrantha]